MLIDNVPELNKVKIETPTDDGKLALILNTMVPRKLDKFDDIGKDLEIIKENDQLDKISMYANYKMRGFTEDGREYGRSYRITLPELEEYISDEIFTNSLSADENFDADQLKVRRLNLVWDSKLKPTLVEELKFLDSEIARVDSEYKATKQDKFILMGTSDKINSEGEVVPNTYIGDDNLRHSIPGVHVSSATKYGDKTIFTIDHDETIGAGTDKVAEGWTAAYTVGGVAKNRFFSSSTPLREVLRLILYGDPQYAGIIYYGAVDHIPDTVEELLQLLAPDGVNYDNLLKPGYTFARSIDMTGKFPIVMMPEAMWNIPELLAEGKAEINGSDVIYTGSGDSVTISGGASHKLIDCDGVWLDKPWIDSEGVILSDQFVTVPDISVKTLQWVNPNQKTIEFRIWYVDQAVGEQITDHDSHKWTFRFKEQ